jgi:predicted metal-binding protein
MKTHTRSDLAAPRRTTLVTKEDLMHYHDPERIGSYCRSCDKYGVFWSCPPFAVSPLSVFPEWTHAVIVCQKTQLEAGTTKEQLISRFLDSRLGFANYMQRLEARGHLVTALVAGHCSCCETCTRPLGKACCKPKGLRYSLEAVGFDVTSLAEGLTKQKVHWPKSGIPEYLMTVGALLCPSKSMGEELCEEGEAGSS